MAASGCNDDAMEPPAQHPTPSPSPSLSPQRIYRRVWSPTIDAPSPNATPQFKRMNFFYPRRILAKYEDEDEDKKSSSSGSSSEMMSPRQPFFPPPLFPDFSPSLVHMKRTRDEDEHMEEAEGQPSKRSRTDAAAAGEMERDEVQNTVIEETREEEAAPPAEQPDDSCAAAAAAAVGVEEGERREVGEEDIGGIEAE
ncbi:unnamed protein product [Vitrella brassicaformis CCMP3155]|uniref:Uncharacterized protein n=1 Tax=Vitrella brassicaformis (strain CCMP3155) TaxID=1169540 RepID=A0A0G4G9V0_VITBC|nr:unnamed protein product [Vitrella brassicaformis CCMP3155]|mmetsp:Transcript_16472/g.39548  ORF Transcript_16472/g.39548 Transcript_16472/m.39548 type:complete len:197 (-) Transcript_16472:103-693(-)|eukprot:CEM25724.1 unnamed protein product [Vitrella brassicaformis CCMP3155]